MVAMTRSELLSAASTVDQHEAPRVLIFLIQELASALAQQDTGGERV